MTVKAINPAISQAQLEVWEMKARLYERVKSLPLDQAIRAALAHAQETMAQLLNEGALDARSNKDEKQV